MINYNNKVLVVFNQKGGVGKTTTVASLAEYAAIKLGKRVLVVDLDMQCNSSDYWVGMDTDSNEIGGQLPPVHPDFEPGDEGQFNQRSAISDIFWGLQVLPHETYINEKSGHGGIVDIIAGHPLGLEEVNIKFDKESGKIETEVYAQLTRFLHDKDLGSQYDLVVMDTGPSRNPIFRAALRAATHAIFPFEPEGFSLQGISSMLQSIQSEQFSRMGPDSELKFVGMMPNKVRNTKLHKTALKDLRAKLPNHMFPEGLQVPLSAAIPERVVKGANPKSIYEIKDGHAARQAFEAISEYTMDQVIFDKQPRSAA